MNDFPFPIEPVQPEDTGLDRSLMINLICKIMLSIGTATSTAISDEIKLSKTIVNALMDDMQKLELIESRGLATAADVRSDIRYALTSKGNRWALDAMSQSQYIGAAPVTLENFIAQVMQQTIRHEKIHRDDLLKSLSSLVLPDPLLMQIGPAANSAKSLLLYGEPGNGKTSIAEALGKAFKDIIFLPHAITVGGQIISYYDPTVHKASQHSETLKKVDRRWVACRRPVIVTGGELTLKMLDLIYNPEARFYEAPIHMKALGGIFIIDDFGRQQAAPRDILNRWIVPLEKGHDYLSLHSGTKFMVPFDQLVIFSTNLHPTELSDEAALRRIYFKIKVPTPTKDDYVEIFRLNCENRNIPYDHALIDEFFEDHYKKDKLVPSGSHPGFLLDHVKAACAFHNKPERLTRALLELAWKNVYASRQKSAWTEG